MRYEIIHQIKNSCSLNMMRDIFFDEADISDPEAYVRAQFPDKEPIITASVAADGSTVIDADVSGLIHQFTFTQS